MFPVTNARRTARDQGASAWDLATASSDGRLPSYAYRSGFDPAGSEVRIADIEEPVIYLFAFQSWCPGCHLHGFPTLKTVRRKLRDAGMADMVKLPAHRDGGLPDRRHPVDSDHRPRPDRIVHFDGIRVSPDTAFATIKRILALTS